MKAVCVDVSRGCRMLLLAEGISLSEKQLLVGPLASFFILLILIPSYSACASIYVYVRVLQLMFMRERKHLLLSSVRQKHCTVCREDAYANHVFINEI